MSLGFIYNDAGHKFFAPRSSGDCGVRAIVNVTEENYMFVRGLVEEQGKREYGKKRSDGRTYTRLSAVKNIMRMFGYTFVDVRKNPIKFKDWDKMEGRYLIWCPWHFSAIIDGNIEDMFDPRLHGIHTVKGYWYKKE